MEMYWDNIDEWLPLVVIICLISLMIVYAVWFYSVHAGDEDKIRIQLDNGQIIEGVILDK